MKIYTKLFVHMNYVFTNLVSDQIRNSKIH